MSSIQFYPDVIGSISDLGKLESLSALHKQEYKGHQVIWRVWGNGSPVVLLHGGSGSWNHWCRNIKTLVGLQHQVWVPDIPCFGDSDAPEGVMDIDQASDVLLEGLNLFFVNEKFDLIGFSMGSMGAGYIAKHIPDCINQLILVAPPALGISPKESIVIEDWTRAPDEQSKNRMIRSNLASLMLSNDSAITDLSLTIHRENLLKDRMRRRKIYKTDFLMAIIKSLEISFHCILGSHDALYSENLDSIRSKLMGLEKIHSINTIQEAGHWVQFEKADEFNELLKGILR